MHEVLSLSCNSVYAFEQETWFLTFELTHEVLSLRCSSVDAFVQNLGFWPSSLCTRFFLWAIAESMPSSKNSVFDIWAHARSSFFEPQLTPCPPVKPQGLTFELDPEVVIGGISPSWLFLMFSWELVFAASLAGWRTRTSSVSSGVGVLTSIPTNDINVSGNTDRLFVDRVNRLTVGRYLKV